MFKLLLVIIRAGAIVEMSVFFPFSYHYIEKEGKKQATFPAKRVDKGGFFCGKGCEGKVHKCVSSWKKTKGGKRGKGGGRQNRKKKRGYAEKCPHCGRINSV